MVIDVVQIVVLGVLPKPGLGIDLASHLPPAVHRMGTAAVHVQPLTVRDGLFRLLLDLRLSLPQYILNFLLPSLRVIGGRVESLPPAILPFTTAALAVDTFLPHPSSLPSCQLTGPLFIFVFKVVRRLVCQKLLLEDVVGERGLNLPDAVFVQMCLPRFHRPRHHVNVGMMPLIMERRVSPEILRRDVRSCRNVIAVSTEQGLPCLRIVVAKTFRVFPVQRKDMGPDVAGVVLQFRHGSAETHIVRITEQTVISQALRTGPRCDVLQVTIRLLHLLPVFLQGQGDEPGWADGHPG